ncbi:MULTISPECIES: tetratricopeptide repeat protein [unclassified Microcoleus]|uniref:tetratricopeptide repeat protein n=1 Tax=unclassified Microcoleus TaxID=2642155 RepID=UPI0025F354A7|nr:MULTISPECIES: tetratricopeptide repeat protein [unclassified Microcoleus]
MGDDRTAMVNWVKKALSAFQNSPLTDAQCSLIDQFLQGKTIQNAAKDSGYSQSHAKRVSADISEAIALEMGEVKRINKSSWLPKIRDYLRQQPESDFVDGEGPIAHPSIPNQNFVGRERAIDYLNIRINQGAKIIVIQAPGGVGKTTLAQEYLNSQGFDLVLELLMAKEKENITLVESVIEEWLKRDFQEEPGREFGVTLGRLKRQLQTRRVGILIDNLEPALDGQGRFIEPHRRYVELLRVLADYSVQSVTLITSREPLAEGVGIINYSLPSLDEQAWQDFFSRDIEIDVTTLKEIHKAYGGNALAMTILCDPIQRDGGMVAYWQEHKVEAGLLVELAVENLVKEQFNRLAKTYPEAYRLLCRLGCYRYQQDVPTVPTEGLLCLLWDVPEAQRRRVIDSLRSRSLVEGLKGEYWLHPVIRAEAIARLRDSEDLEKANHKAAEFWRDSVLTVETIEDAVKALESYFHYIEIANYELAGQVLVKKRDNKWVKKAALGQSFYRLGRFETLIKIIVLIIEEIYINLVDKSLLYTILGDLYWLTGKINKAINCHEKCYQIVNNSLNNKNYCSEEIRLKFRENKIGSLLNLGLCQIALGELEKADDFLQQSILFANSEGLISGTIRSCWFSIAFVKSCLGLTEEARHFAEKNENSNYKTNGICTEWSRGNKLFFLAHTYKNLGELEKSRQLFLTVISDADESGYTQVKGQAFSGLAELYRIQGEFETALSHHSESIALLEKIGAKCDLAEAHYQLALTHQKMGDTENSQTHFQEAIRLFTEMEAPKQVEKVRKAIGKSDEV